MELRFKSYDLFGITALLLLLASLIIPETLTFDVHFYDTYYIIGVRHIYRACIILTGFFWIIYRISDGWLLSKVFLMIHIAVTILSVLFFAIISISVDKVIPPVSDDSSLSVQSEYFRSISQLYRIIELTLFFLTIFQLFFFINIVGGVLRKTLVIRK